MKATKEEIINYKNYYLEQYKDELNAIKHNSNFRRLIRSRMYYPPELLYAEAKDILDAIENGQVKKENVQKTVQLALVSLSAIQEDKFVEDIKLVRKK